MIDVKEAAEKATDYLMTLIPEAGKSNVQLEEVELTDDDKYWLITLSYPLTNPLLNVALKRDYKLFKVDSENGQVRSMKIRKLG